MKYKKIFSILSAISFSLLLLSACSSAKSNSQNGSSAIFMDKSTETYASIKRELEKTEQLEANYFAKYYDLTPVNEAKKAAEIAISNSSEDEYESVFKTLSSENSSLDKFIETEEDKIYNIQTEDMPQNEYPFQVHESDLPEEWSFQPIVMQSSKFPSWVITSQPDTTDGKPSANLFINDSSSNYDFSINTISTKEIKVQDENEEIKTALVNTEVIFKQQENYGRDKDTALNERPAYLVKNKNGTIVLLLQSYEGEDYYVPYG